MPSPNAAARRLLPLLLIGTVLGAAPAGPAAAQPETPEDAVVAGDAPAPRPAAAPAAGARRSARRDRDRPAARRAGSGRRSVERLQDNPASETVVTRRQLNQRNVQSLQQALAYTPEASLDISGYDPRSDAIDIRGFDVTYTGIYRDGLRQSAVDLTIPRVEPYGAESVTVLRGPAATIFGTRAPGGIVNVTTKRPQFDPSGEVIFQAGNYDRTQGNFDLTGPVEGSDGTMAYRLTGLVREAGTYLPGAPDDRVFVAPAFTWKPDADTTFTVLTEYLHSRLPSNPSYYYFPGYNITRLYQGAPAYGPFEQSQFRVGYLFEHRFSPDLIVRQNFRYQGTTVDFPAVRFYRNTTNAASNCNPFETANVNPAAGTACGYAFLGRENLGSFALDNQVEGHADTGPVAHVLLAGIDYIRYDYGRRTGNVDFTAALNLPVLIRGLQVVAPPALRTRATQSQDQVGTYLQEQAKWDRFVLTLNGRFDWVSSRTDRFFDEAPTGSETQNDTAFTYGVGLNYLLTPDIVPYAGYATTFTPQPGIGGGNVYPPARGDQIDAGVKFAVPDKNLTGSISAFDVTQSSNSDRNLNTVFFQVPVGSVAARGFEMEMTATPSPGTSLTLAYRHLDFRFTRQTASGVMDDGRQVTAFPVSGNVPGGIPGDTFSAFASYLFPNASALSGLTVGGGIRFTGPSFASDFDMVRNPTVTLFDALLAYDLAALDPRYKGFRAQINGFNVFDRRYFNCQNIFCYRGPPATVIGSLVYRW